MNDHCHPLGLKLPLFLQKKPDFKTLVSRGGCGMGSSAPYEYNWKFSKLPSVEMKWWSGKTRWNHLAGTVKKKPLEPHIIGKV